MGGIPAIAGRFRIDDLIVAAWLVVQPLFLAPSRIGVDPGPSTT